MGSSAQSLLAPPPGPNRRGVALLSGILALVAVGVLVAGMFVISDLDAKSVKNRESSSRAMHITEAGVAHALGVLRSQFKTTLMTQLIRGADGTWGTADDGRLVGYSGLTSANEIPAAGRAFDGGTYFVKLRDDPADADGDVTRDSNYRLLLECRGVTADGATADVNVVVSHLMLPGVAVDGNLEISGKLNVKGECGGAHVNGQFSGGGEPSAVLRWSSTTGSIPSKFIGTKLTGSVPMEIPDLDPMSHCPAGATITSVLPSISMLDGVYCVNGDVTLVGDIGSLLSMRNVTIIATGSIKIPGKPFFRSAHPDGYVLLAGGDLDLQGDSGFEGVLYCGGQTYISSKVTIIGQLICKDKTPHPGADWVPKNLISGDANITFECSSTLNRNYRILAWYPTHGG